MFLKVMFITLNPNLTNSDDEKQFIFIGLSIRNVKNVKNHSKIKKVIEMQTNLHRNFLSFVYICLFICIAIGDLVIKRGRVGILLTGLTPTLFLCLS